MITLAAKLQDSLIAAGLPVDGVRIVTATPFVAEPSYSRPLTAQEQATAASLIAKFDPVVEKDVRLPKNTLAALVEIVGADVANEKPAAWALDAIREARVTIATAKEPKKEKAK